MKKKHLKFISLILLLGLSLTLPLQTAAQEEKTTSRLLTRAEMAVMLSATSYIKKKVTALWDWTIGYDIRRLGKATLAPVIKSIIAVPKRVPPDGRTIFQITATLDDPGGLANILRAKADLSGIGKLSGLSLVDTGLWGDDISGDGVYTLQISVPRDAIPGEKEIPVTVINKKGWVTLGRTKMLIKLNPEIIGAKVTPPLISGDGKATALIEIHITNPGHARDITRGVINLSKIGYSSASLLYDDGTHGDFKAHDNIFTLETTVKPGTSKGEKLLPFRITNFAGGSVVGDIRLAVK